MARARRRSGLGQTSALHAPGHLQTQIWSRDCGPFLTSTGEQEGGSPGDRSHTGSNEKTAKGAWRCRLGPGTAGHLALGRRPRACFHEFRPTNLGTCFPVSRLQLRLGWALKWREGVDRKKWPCSRTLR